MKLELISNISTDDKRWAKARQVLPFTKHIANGMFEVPSLSRRGEHHDVDLAKPSCSCEDWAMHQTENHKVHICFHILASRLRYGEIVREQAGKIFDERMKQ